jgi:TRAP-type C4-dicarboxylate transport system permease small subunit
MSVLARGLVSARKAAAKLLEIVLMVAVAVLVLDVLWGVATRYLLGEQSSWTEELARVLLIWVVLLGGAVAFGTREHLGVDYFVDKMDQRTKRRMRIIVDLAVLVFTVSVLVIGGLTLVTETFRLGQMMMAIGIPKGYVYLAVPVSGVFFLLFSVESIFAALFGSPEADEGGEASV